MTTTRALRSGDIVWTRPGGMEWRQVVPATVATTEGATARDIVSVVAAPSRGTARYGTRPTHYDVTFADGHYAVGIGATREWVTAEPEDDTEDDGDRAEDPFGFDRDIPGFLATYAE